MRYTYHGITVESGRVLDSTLFTPKDKKQKTADSETRGRKKPQAKKPAQRKK